MWLRHRLLLPSTPKAGGSILCGKKKKKKKAREKREEQILEACKLEGIQQDPISKSTEGRAQRALQGRRPEF